jgi:hypothetical protein
MSARSVSCFARDSIWFQVLSTLDSILLFHQATTCGYVSVAVVTDCEVLENTWQTFWDEIVRWTSVLKRLANHALAFLC